MVLTAQQLDALMPDASQLESDELQAEKLAQQLRSLGIEPE
ncbi:MAG: hypothetical protein WAN66_00055 [Limnoraphis robusta]